MKKNSVTVFCRDTQSSKLDFFLSADGREIYLFTTKYFSREIYHRYKNGRRIPQILRDSANVRQQKLKERILRMVRYIAKEESVLLPVRTKKPIDKECNSWDYEAL